MNKKLITKALAIGVAYLMFYIMMSLASNPTGSASSISQALKWLSFGVNEKYGVLTLIVIAFSADSFFKRIL
jgi:hypothetical protein